MDTKDVSEMKRALEKKIENLLNDFSKKSGTRVTDISLHRVRSSSDAPDRYIVGLRAEVE